MRIFDRLMRRKKRTPRVVYDVPGMLTVQARGCRIVINENGRDKRGRTNTIIMVDISTSRMGEFQLVTNPATPLKSRSHAAFHVVQLKQPRKPKRAKPPEQEKANEGPSGGGGEGTQSMWALGEGKGGKP